MELLIYVRTPRYYRAGYKITVIDKSEKDWWKGKCLGGRAGYFPSAYVMRVESGQRTLQVTRNLQLADQTLLRDQVSRVLHDIRNGSKRSAKYLDKKININAARTTHIDI